MQKAREQSRKREQEMESPKEGPHNRVLGTKRRPMWLKAGAGKHLFVKGQLVNILSFMGHPILGATAKPPWTIHE
jgi:hypothetical protein